MSNLPHLRAVSVPHSIRGGETFMPGKIDAVIAKLGLTIPEASVPIANYVPWVRTGNLVFVAGQLPLDQGTVKYTGIAGRDLITEQAYAAAKLCALNLIAQAKAAT